ncbi:M20 family metallopeptidase [Kribbella sp. NPDC005582]|uniref:M20 family metallopeptidase n=1 Tax=Kribbella sp. NPDC005582 TaxID=3156893 RepID=UPI0033B38324
MIAAEEQRLLARIDEDLLLRVCTALIRATGQNPPGEEAATVAVLDAIGRELGLTVTTTTVEPGRDNISLSVGTGTEPGLLLLGHTDVVPVGAGWTTDPYGAEIRDGRIYGRGASDMKGGLAAAVAALAVLRDVELSGPVELAAVVDEEETGLGIQAFVRDNARAYAGCITAEPTDLQTIIAARGDSYLRVAVHGRAVHAGNAKDGANAIYGATAIITEIERLHDELAADPHPLLGPATWSVGQINGGTGGSIVPAECVVIADRRLLPGESPEAILADLRDRVAGLQLEARGLSVDLEMPMAMPPFETPADAELVSITEAARRDAGGPDVPLAGWGAACDGGYVDRDLGIPVVILGPGSVAHQAHRADESVPIEELAIAARAYVLAACRLLG